MWKKIKQLTSDNWKAALLGAIASALVVLFGLPADTLFSVGGSAAGIDEDVRAEICEGYEPEGSSELDESE